MSMCEDRRVRVGMPCGVTRETGICWSHESKFFPQCKQRIHLVLNIYYYSLTGCTVNPPHDHGPVHTLSDIVDILLAYK